MALSAPVKALALVVFLAAIAGATYAVQTSLGDTVSAQLVGVSAERDLVNATGGHNVTYILTLTNRDSSSRDVVVEVAGAATGRSGTTTVRPNANATIFVEVAVPASAPAGDHALDVRILGDGKVLREREGLLHLKVLPATPGFAQGDRAQVVYTGRLSATGRVFNTNDHELVGLGIPKTDTYRFSEGILTVSTVPRPSVVAGVYEGLLGMQPGESRTITFGPEKGYGNATEEEVFDRDDVLERVLTLENSVQRVPRDAFDTYVVESGQGAPEDFDVGSIFTLDQNDNDWPYRIVSKTNDTVEYRLAATVGSSFTVYPFWPNASVIEDINDTTVVFRTTPTTAIGEAITYRSFWPTMSSVAEVNETSIVVRHTPPVGYKYTQVSQAGQPREATVKEVSDERIVVAIPSQNPLAGRDLTFDLRMLAVEKGR